MTTPIRDAQHAEEVRENIHKWPSDGRMRLEMALTLADYWRGQAQAAEKDAERYRWLRETDELLARP